MKKALEKQLITPPKSPKKFKLDKFNAVMIVITIISLGLIGYAVLSYINHPDTYEELLPLMDEAQAFEMRASELSGEYEDIETQVGEEAYFNTIEKDYEGAAEVHARMIADIADTNAKIQAAGGITTYEELQRVKVPAINQFDANQVEDYFDSNASVRTAKAENEAMKEEDGSILEGVIDAQ